MTHIWQYSLDATHEVTRGILYSSVVIQVLERRHSYSFNKIETLNYNCHANFLQNGTKHFAKVIT
jgi:hypothetical protein